MSARARDATNGRSARDAAARPHWIAARPNLLPPVQARSLSLLFYLTFPYLDMPKPYGYGTHAETNILFT